MDGKNYKPMGRILTNEEFQGLSGESVKVLTDSEFRDMVNTATPGQPTTGIWDALRKGLSNTKDIIQESGNELSDVMATPTGDNLKGKFVKTAAAAGKLIKAPIKIGAELALATPARVAGEVVENATNVDVNEATAQKAGQLMKKGLDNEKVRQAMAWYNGLKEKDPEAALALGAVGDIIDAASNAVGLGATKQAVSGTLRGAKTAAQTTAEAVESGAKAAVKPVKELTGGKTGEYAAAQIFALNPETVRQVLKNPDVFTPSEMAKIDRESIFNKVKTAIDSRLENLSETGKAYEGLRSSKEKVVFPENFGNKVLSKFGIGVDENGKLSISAESLPLGQGDITALENFIKLYGKGELSVNGLLNARKALDNLSAWGADKTSGGKTIARALRSELDAFAKKSVKGLAELDAKYAPERQLLGKVKSAIYNADGTLKDNAVQKIANLTGKGKELAIERMEKIVPGIREDLNILKAIEDVQAAGGQKVGTYMRAIGGVGAGAAVGGPVGAILGVLATSPKVGIALLRTYAKYKNLPKSQVSGIVEKMKAGKKLIGEELQVMNEAVDNAAKKAGGRVKELGKKGGMSIQDVSKDTTKQVQYYTQAGWKTLSEIADEYANRTAATKDQALEWARSKVKGFQGRVKGISK